ncbi:3,4-dihydroxy-2-butanone-4-phosphate synthase RIB3 [Cyberlindnera jadinii NRRL Y-1542]|uniref:3,4-dihydroxy-2-butanone 4-phosphate synthase n=1 Tax=Cyberlindnera jadinii (strain ATCC 18201 / CBS 1600 / BCRC 20928 / JCM 3617 / NBRC 0987 / NRRL Y-1542) TaxID=983966 RepID=A0A1E4S847_CYBJN|nr:3,4-dihydroxy-2-butanone 4-phosphate synthase [Cyberlindnera jadinii NRRL Y-1542]ODV75681.1 3,4-dihydroxy-2-butanone 4-phosphate synthase [Cyberlindnera jadinii NRRL Y-1542]
MAFTPIPEALEAYKNGEFLIVMDDESRENEGDLIIAAELVTSEKMAFLVRHSSGFICVPLSNAKADALDLPPMVKDNQDRHGTAYTVTADASEDVTTGISARDRAVTVQTMASAKSTPGDLRRPGHICPLRAVDGLLQKRQGHTEAGVQLSKLAGLQEAACICELVRDQDGLMMRLEDCEEFGSKYNIKIITIESLIKYIEQENLW